MRTKDVRMSNSKGDQVSELVLWEDKLSEKRFGFLNATRPQAPPSQGRHSESRKAPDLCGYGRGIRATDRAFTRQ
jgi:hypothetical protein